MTVAQIVSNFRELYRRALRRALAVAVIGGGTALLSAAEPRVTTWSLNPGVEADAAATAAVEESLINNAAGTLNTTDSDVIVLRGVRDRQQGQRLAERLWNGPFAVVVCSDFKSDSGSAAAGNQVAILSRKPAFAAWSENWKPDGAAHPEGGFAFAGIQFGDTDLCLYAFQLTAGVSATGAESGGEHNPNGYETAVPELIRHATSVGNSSVNRSRAFVVIGDFGAKRLADRLAQIAASHLFKESGFQSAFEDLSISDQNGQTTGDGLPAGEAGFVFVRNAHLSGRPQMLPSSGGSFPAVTYGVLVAPSAPVTAVVSPAAPSGVVEMSNRLRSILLWLILGTVVIVLAVLFGRGIRELLPFRRQALAPSSNANFSTALTRTTYVNPLAADAASGGQVAESPTQTSSSDVPLWRQQGARRTDEAKASAEDKLRPHLARMMKDKLLWRLMAQRSQTIQIHDASAKVVAELEQRLALIQSHFESRVQSYENRIAELERELVAKESINRELLESKVQLARTALEDASPPKPKPSVVYTLRFGDLMARKTTVRTQTRQGSDLF